MQAANKPRVSARRRHQDTQIETTARWGFVPTGETLITVTKESDKGWGRARRNWGPPAWLAGVETGAGLLGKEQVSRQTPVGLERTQCPVQPPGGGMCTRYRKVGLQPQQPPKLQVLEVKPWRSPRAPEGHRPWRSVSHSVTPAGSSGPSRTRCPHPQRCRPAQVC